MKAKFSQSEAEEIRDLLAHPGWQVYAQELKLAVLESAKTALEEGTDFSRGFFAGLKRAQAIPQWIIADSIEDTDKRLAAFPNEQLAPEELDALD